MKITELQNHGDTRGFSATCNCHEFQFPARLKEVHCTTLAPGAVRGNHYHLVRTEIIFVWRRDSCRIAWDEGDGTAIQVSDYVGSGQLVIEVEPHFSHAIGNTGSQEMVVMALSDFLYSPNDPDAFPRKVL